MSAMCSHLAAIYVAIYVSIYLLVSWSLVVGHSVVAVRLQLAASQLLCTVMLIV